MSESSTVIFERTTRRIATVTFANPPANLTVGETLARLASIVDDLESEPAVGRGSQRGSHRWAREGLGGTGKLAERQQ